MSVPCAKWRGAQAASEVLTRAGDGRRLLVYQAPPGTAEHDALVLLAMTAADARTR